MSVVQRAPGVVRGGHRVWGQVDTGLAYGFLSALTIVLSTRWLLMALNSLKGNNQVDGGPCRPAAPLDPESYSSSDSEGRSGVSGTRCLFPEQLQ